ncbi:hypothetical protein CDAR_574831 [Caerostris darwini]|uniref:Uncharacterized protein n=1 Tax=Caerostris darwini TaxID=1538125 RepID=A0AAV4SWF2_9ARAC|nr:hypothetical protein CDAR_574831 [Caerostris darwini]
MTADETKSIPRPLNLLCESVLDVIVIFLFFLVDTKICQDSGGFVSVSLPAVNKIVGSSNISFIQGNFRAIIEGDSGGRSQSNDLISSPGNPWRKNRK